MYKCFLEKIMDNIVEQSKLPKIQTERIIQSFLEPFIATVIAEVLKPKGKNITLVSTEFPMKKEESSQSDNADFLLLDDETMYIVELKTASPQKNEHDEKQFKNYLDFSNRVLLNRSFGDLVNDIQQITDDSKQKAKYAYLLSHVREKIGSAIKMQIKQIYIIYITPSKYRDTFYSKFTNPSEVNNDIHIKWYTLNQISILSLDKHIYADIWDMLRERLATVDNIRSNRDLLDDR